MKKEVEMKVDFDQLFVESVQPYMFAEEEVEALQTSPADDPLKEELKQESKPDEIKLEVVHPVVEADLTCIACNALITVIDDTVGGPVSDSNPSQLCQTCSNLHSDADSILTPSLVAYSTRINSRDQLKGSKTERSQQKCILERRILQPSNKFPKKCSLERRNPQSAPEIFQQKCTLGRRILQPSDQERKQLFLVPRKICSFLDDPENVQSSSNDDNQILSSQDPLKDLRTSKGNLSNPNFDHTYHKHFNDQQCIEDDCSIIRNHEDNCKGSEHSRNESNLEEHVEDNTNRTIHALDDSNSSEFVQGDSSNTNHYQKKSKTSISLPNQPRHGVVLSKRTTDGFVTGARRTIKIENQRTCPVCNKIFHRGSLKRHMRDHPTEEKKVEDETFAKPFTKESDVIEHIPIQSAGKPLQCKVCRRKFTSKKRLKKHLKLPHRYIYECSICKVKFACKEDLTRHRKEHIGKKHYKCDKCEKHFTNNFLLMKHMDSCGPLDCNICGKTFKSRSLLITHTRVHTGERPFSCDLCDKSFSRKSILRLHKNSHVGDKPLCCELCGARFTQKGSLTRHHLLHSGRTEKPHQCLVCHKSFAIKAYLENHKLTHTADRPYQCRACDKAFKQRFLLRMHEQQFHNPVPDVGDSVVLNCNVCDKTFSSNASLRSHMMRHTQKYECTICYKSFTTKGYLTLHLTIHSGIKAYTCDVCQKSFSLPTGLKLHYRTHTGERPYTCDVCNKSFPMKGHLIAHKRLHTGEKPFSCDVCQKAFAQKGNMDQHREIHFKTTTSRKRKKDKC